MNVRICIMNMSSGSKHTLPIQSTKGELWPGIIIARCNMQVFKACHSSCIMDCRSETASITTLILSSLVRGVNIPLTSSRVM